MRLIIISGLSGSGKSIALNTLEDEEYFCVDNMPIGMLEEFTRHIAEPGYAHYKSFAIGIDSRNYAHSRPEFDSIIQKLKEIFEYVEIIFLKSNMQTLLKRFSETRRKHPLSTAEIPLEDAIKYEHVILEPIHNTADLVIDTSNTNIHQLREMVIKRLGSDKKPMSLLFRSFGFKNGPPIDADLLFDVRCLPNPHWEPSLRPFSGLDQKVVDFLEKSDEVKDMVDDIVNFIQKWLPKYIEQNRKYLTIAIGCTGGFHRSVYIVEKLTSFFKEDDSNINIVSSHRELT
ncbi:MAG: RNase adapter RapZ [Gammaproteobacteria bacterium]|nr:MAG: RNase adapter RapZ [Gammaproteobacteria bacterium]